MSGIDKKQLKHDPVAEWLVHQIVQLKPYTRQITGVLVLVIIVIAGVSWYYSRESSRPNEASYALAMARSEADLQRVITEYPDTFSAVAATMKLAQFMAQQTNYTRAVEYYRYVINDMPDNSMRPIAVRALAKCYFAEGEYDRAIELLNRELLYDKNSYVTVLAQLDLVYILCAADRYEEAWKELEEWNSLVGNSYMASAANGLREEILRVTGISTNQIAQQSYDEPVL
jgi:predicted negative regulator of RcsB-dependent stress response